MMIGIKDLVDFERHNFKSYIINKEGTVCVYQPIHGLADPFFPKTFLVTFVSHHLLNQRQKIKDFVYVKIWGVFLVFNFFTYNYFWRKFHCHELVVYNNTLNFQCLLINLRVLIGPNSKFY